MPLVHLPSSFQARLVELWKPVFPVFPQIGSFSILRAVRVNTLKIDVSSIRTRLEDLGFSLLPVPFCDHAFFVQRPLKRSLGSTIEHSLGYFFVQDGASLLPVLVLDPKPGMRVLDLAAAPGGKATHLAQHMQNTGALVCLDSSRNRLPSLRYSLARLGVVNALVVFESGVHFHRTGAFDRVLLDAPCSCEGLGFSDPGVWAFWSEKLVHDKSVLQKKLILRAFDALVPGGLLVYSTCTLSPEENEFVLDHLLREREGAEIIPFSIPGIELSPGLCEWQKIRLNPLVVHARRVYSPLSHTESFFLAKIKKVR